MEVSRDRNLHMLRHRSEDAKAQLAEQQLPDRVDTDQHADQLARIGIDPQEILEECKRNARPTSVGAEHRACGSIPITVPTAPIPG